MQHLRHAWRARISDGQEDGRLPQRHEVGCEDEDMREEVKLLRLRRQARHMENETW